MARRKVKTEDEKSIPEMTDEVTRAMMREVRKNGRLTATGQRLVSLWSWRSQACIF